MSSAGFMEPFPRVAAAPECSSWCLFRTKNVWGCSPRCTSVFWAGKPSPAWWGWVLVEEHQVQTGILKSWSWAGIFVGKHVNFYTCTTRCVRLCLSIAAQRLLLGRDLSFECIKWKQGKATKIIRSSLDQKEGLVSGCSNCAQKAGWPWGQEETPVSRVLLVVSPRASRLRGQAGDRGSTSHLKAICSRLMSYQLI